MSDIVERLRQRQWETALMDTDVVAVPKSWLGEAADEIERLRAALGKLANPQWGEYRSDEAIVQFVVKIARAALTNGKP